MLLLFVLLNIINIPVFLIYKRYNFYESDQTYKGDNHGPFETFTLGNMGFSEAKCHTLNLTHPHN